ncbi:hypothetical protein OU997_16220 [Pseudomonas sp. SL4(2022)]|uniref:hypothetical protein n=1 Tax=Pseudomonas sp. SL4(2022) TaxID=2994661 RepID=UPI002270752E|nr:hypothetical protein [Pseudomonas sp. SL4(2022)]WAC43781.1 hypothetical protein OU997_16220 [Pseudomonas sp. SL4(2022)]
MTYLGYLNKEQLLNLVDEAFPFVGKPSDSELMYFDDSDWRCKFIKAHMQAYTGPSLPKDGVIYLHSELSNLSAKGMQWFLPSLVRAIIRCTDKYDTLTECLINDLESDESRVQNIDVRYGTLSKAQIQCLESTLEYISEQHGHYISLALLTLERLHA